MPDRALLLVNMGGPSSEDEIEPYLRAIFLDPAILPLPALLRPALARFIAARRAPKVAARYRLIGGRSPLGPLTAAQCAAVREALPARAELSVAHAFRYTEPTLATALSTLADAGVREVRLLPLFPHHTAAMTGSVVREARRVAAQHHQRIEPVAAWGSHPEALALWAESAAAAIEQAGSGARVLMVAHGIPLRNVRRGDRYPDAVLASARGVGERLPTGTDWSLAYQSRVGPVAWTGPYIEDEIARLARAPAPLVLLPLSFVADCLETLYDLDTVARAQAQSAGIERVVRAKVFNDDPRFAALLASLATAASKPEAA